MEPGGRGAGQELGGQALETPRTQQGTVSLCQALLASVTLRDTTTGSKRETKATKLYSGHTDYG